MVSHCVNPFLKYQIYNSLTKSLLPPFSWFPKHMFDLPIIRSSRTGISLNGSGSWG